MERHETILRQFTESMSSIPRGSTDFVTYVYGTVFAARARVVDTLRVGERIILVPDPPGIDEPTVWVHAPGGDVIGHLSPDLSSWLVPAMLDGLRCGADVHAVGGPSVESWKRLQIRVRCHQ